MRSSSGLADRVNIAKMVVAAFIAVQLSLATSLPGRLFSESFRMIRKGVMVDETVCEAAVANAEWRELRTRYFMVYTERGVDLDAVEARLRQRLFIIKYGAPTAGGAEGRIGHRIDSICEQAMELLDMRPNMKSPGIRIFQSSAKLNEAHRFLTGKTGQVKSFYAQDCRTIYTSEDNITDSVLAHEIAHAVVDTNYDGIPPPRIGEMLASYVDMHLSE